MSININHSNNSIKTAGELTLDALNDISVSENRIKDVADPIDLQDAVTKKFLETKIQEINAITDLLLPPQPPVIGSATLGLVGDTAYRITEFTQQDNTGTSQSAEPGDIVNNVLRNTNFSTDIITQVGPGNKTGISIVRNSNTTASVLFDDNDNSGTYSDVDTLTITNNVDYGTITDDSTGFFQCYDVVASGTSPVGWNSIKLIQGSSQTNTVLWYSDQTSVPPPAASNISVTPNLTESLIYSSTVPHYTSEQKFDINFDIANLSGDFYPVSDTFFNGITSQQESAFGILNDLTYEQVGMSTPLPRNYLSGGIRYNITTSVNVRAGTGISTENKGAKAIIDNSYTTNTITFAPAEKILYMQDNLTSMVDETNIQVVNVGTGNGNARRVETLSGDNPIELLYTNYNGYTSTLNDYDATVVGGVLTHDTNDYSTGYLPIGPDLSTGRDSAQYFQVVFNRSAVSKFGIKWSGKVSGCWIKLPGSSIDSASDINGWIDATVPYNGSGVPGVNSNGSNGCALGSVLTTGSTVYSEQTNVTFGTESSSNATDNIIVVRFKLNSGDAVTALQFLAAS